MIIGNGIKKIFDKYHYFDSYDFKLLNNHLQKILAGETVKIPTFNFVSGSKEYRGRT